MCKVLESVELGYPRNGFAMCYESEARKYRF